MGAGSFILRRSQSQLNIIFDSEKEVKLVNYKTKFNPKLIPPNLPCLVGQENWSKC
jgi:hypothetical protein